MTFPFMTLRWRGLLALSASSVAMIAAWTWSRREPQVDKAAIAVPTTPAVADVAIPSHPAPPTASRPATPNPHPMTLRTRWPAVLPGSPPCVLTLSSPSDKDIFRWSSSSGAAMTLDHSHEGNPPLPSAFLRDPPRTLTWTQHGLPGKRFFHDLVEMPNDPHPVDLAVWCNNAAVGWRCDDREASCRISLMEHGVAGVARYRVGDQELQRTIQAGSGARELLVADAVRLAEDLCAGNRCSDVVSRAVERLRAVTTRPPWKITRQEQFHLELTAPDAPGDEVSCDDAAPRPFCTLTLGGTVHFLFHPYTGDDPYAELFGDTWRLSSPSTRWSYYSIDDEAVP